MNDPRFDRDHLYRRNNLRDGWWILPALVRRDGCNPDVGDGVMEWQPIETAPKDGTSVILGCNYDRFGKQRVTCAWYEEDMWVEAKHWDDDADDWGYLECAFRPSHWMPLPEPPQ